MTRPRLLIEEWLPAQAIGVECMRERSTGQQPPDKRLHVWWARRPLVASRAAVLASLLPADFDRNCFERLLGFGISSSEIVRIRALMDLGVQVQGGFGYGRAFSNVLREPDLQQMHNAMVKLWGEPPTILDSMAGGGSIPLEAARLGLNVLANEYNPVACSVLESILDYPFRFGQVLAEKVRKWGRVWEQRAAERLAPFYPKEKLARVYAYIFARTVPCPDTGHPTPLAPNWYLRKPKNGLHIVAEPVILNRDEGEWTIRVREIGKEAGQLRHPPQPTYGHGKGLSLFTQSVIPADYIKAMAQQGKMGIVLYAVATKATSRLEFRPTNLTDLKALRSAEKELERLRPQWESNNVIPTEDRYKGDCDRSYIYGLTTWASLFSPRQLLSLGVLVEELDRLQPQILQMEGEDLGEAVVHLLAFVINKCTNYNSTLSVWHPYRSVVANTFSKHDFSFKATFAEMPTCVAGGGLRWAINNVTKAYEDLAKLSQVHSTNTVFLTQGSATSLLELDNQSVTAVVVDPPYADNVQYSELADFFYVWLKRTQGHRRPEWFSTYLCDHDEEAVVNISRHRDDGKLTAKKAKREAQAHYQQLMAETFEEAHRVLRNDGVLTVMFTHKQQSAWATLFQSLITAGFTITATWPVQTESQHSLHQAKKNAAQSTVLLVARKREPALPVPPAPSAAEGSTAEGSGAEGPGTGRAYFDDAMQAEIRQVAQVAAARLRDEGLNAVDQLVGAFGPAMEVFSRYDEVRTDTGDPVSVDEAIQTAADAVADWRVEQLAQRGLTGVDDESRFVLLCWDVLGAATFRFNEAMLLGRSVGMDVNSLIAAGLVTKKSANINLLSAKKRRRERAVQNVAEQMSFLESQRRGRRRGKRKVHPNDEYFASAIDMCHALALRYEEAGGGQAGIGAARGMALQQGWNADGPCARLMEALVKAAPSAVRFSGEGKKKTAADDFPEFRAWHAMLKPLFGLEPPQWERPMEAQPTLPGME
jgi:putative DNA methylase